MTDDKTFEPTELKADGDAAATPAPTLEAPAPEAPVAPAEPAVEEAPTPEAPVEPTPAPEAVEEAPTPDLEVKPATPELTPEAPAAEPTLEVTPEPTLDPAPEAPAAEPSLETATLETPEVPEALEAPKAPEAPTSEVLDKPIASPDESFLKKNKLYIIGGVVGLIVVTVVVGILLSVKNSDELEGRLKAIEGTQTPEPTIVDEDVEEKHAGMPTIIPAK
jgi:hypothetical protein